MAELFSDEYYMKMALAEAHKAFEADEIPIGAVVVCENKVIGKSYNLTEKLNDVTAHAEMQAITSAANYLGAKYLIGCTLYVTIEPCLMCAGALYWSQVSRIVYGARDEKRGYSKIGHLLHPKTEVLAGVLQEECSLLVKEFFKKLR